MGWRADFKRDTQQMYGGYCSNLRQRGLEPMPYHKFTDLAEKGLTTKQIIRMELEVK